MNTQKYHFAIVVLLLGVVLLPVTTASQSADRDLGIVRLRYANSLPDPQRIIIIGKFGPSRGSLPLSLHASYFLGSRFV